MSSRWARARKYPLQFVTAFFVELGFSGYRPFSESENELRVTFSLVALLLAAFIGILGEYTPMILVPTSLCLLVGAVVTVRRVAVRRLGTSKTLCVLFFMLAVAHICVGFLLAGLTADHTSICSNGQIFFSQAMLINSIGLFAGVLGYSYRLERRASRLIPRIPDLVDQNTAERLFSVLLLLGSALMFFVYWKLNLLAFLASPSQLPFIRYVTSDVMGGSATDEWLVNRAMDLLTVSLPFILFRAVKRPQFLTILLAVVGYFALLLPLRRANLLAVTLTFLILLGIERKNAYRLTRKVFVSAAFLYVLSQCIFLLGFFATDVSPRQILTVSSTALPEVRDLGWTLSLLNGETLHGVTFAQALMPLPSIASDWSSAHSLRAISTKLIGLDESGQTGGLRLTILGEGYINFGYFGAIAAGFLWGVAVGWCEKSLQAAGKHNSEFANYFAVMCFVWVCFLIYLAGTQAAAPVKTGALLVLGIAWASKHRSAILQPQPVPLA
jgi:hypothetical protein